MSNTTPQQHDTFMLGWIAAVIRWCEDLINLLSGPLLTLGLGISLIALLTNGELLVTWPILLYIWAGSQALGVDTQLVSMWDHARIALRERRYWALVGYILLGGVLAYIAWVAADVFAMTEAYGITTGEALHRLGMDDSTWLIQRTALQVFLVALAGWTRYHKPKVDTAAEAAEEKAKLEAQLTLEPLRNQVRAQQASGLNTAWSLLRGKPIEAPAASAHGAPSPESPRPPTGGGSPVQQAPEEPTEEPPVEPLIRPVPPDAPNVTPIRAPRTRKPRRKVAKNKAPRLSVEDKARGAYKPGMSASELARVAGIGQSAASKYRRILEAEANQAAK